MTTVELKVDGMTCGGCEESVVRALTRIDGVSEVKADHSTGTVVVAGEGLVPEALGAAVEDAGYAIRP